MSAKEKLQAHENTLKIENALRQMKNRRSSIAGDPSIFIDADGNEFKTTDRIVSHVSQPILTIPSDSELFSRSGLPDYKLMKEHFKGEGKLSQSQVLKIIRMATAIFEKEPNMLQIESPVTVCGDVHGQLYDLIKLFDIAGDPENTSFLFLGDYVDRGYYSLEVLLLLYAIKINFPKSFFMLRGNHETAQMTQHFTFKSECLRKYSLDVYRASLKSFMALPIVAIMNGQFFCVHGGISKDIKYLSDIDKINRFVVDFPSSGPYCDLMWSDPSSDYDDEANQRHLHHRKDFTENHERGCSYMYSYNAVTKFLQRNKLLSIIRAHQAQDKGYRMYAPTSQSFPSVISLFSAPNYCGTYGNKAAVLKYDTATMNIRQFSSQTEPYHLPNFMNVFTWSIPFVAERICEILLAVLNICSEEELEKDTPLSKELAKSLMDIQNERQRKASITEGTNAIAPPASPPLELNDNEQGEIGEVTEPKTLDRNALRRKILAIGRVSRMFHLLRQEAEKVEQLRSLSGGLTLPKGVLINGSDELDRQLSQFERVRLADLSNEALPPSIEQQNKIEQEEYEYLKRKADEDIEMTL
ncbi:calcineurin catalytic subunit A [Martiniozyma asiatica (nom. inval.)]|nr:calcineurin catalytic subunit A [Martiniozyma asiatica]